MLEIQKTNSNLEIWMLVQKRERWFNFFHVACLRERDGDYLGKFLKNLIFQISKLARKTQKTHFRSFPSLIQIWKTMFSKSPFSILKFFVFEQVFLFSISVE